MPLTLTIRHDTQDRGSQIDPARRQYEGGGGLATDFLARIS